MFGNISLLLTCQIKVGFNIGIPFKEMDFCRYCNNVTNSISDYAKRFNQIDKFENFILNVAFISYNTYLLKQSAIPLTTGKAANG